MADNLAKFLGGCRPFDALNPVALQHVVSAARLESFGAGALIVDAFEEPTVEIFVVIDGRVSLWNSPNWPDSHSDEIVGPGAVFGFSSLLTEESVGPRAVAKHDSLIARVPGAVAGPAFMSKSGAKFLAEHTTKLRNLTPAAPQFSTVEQLVVKKPLMVSDQDSIINVAQRMTELDLPCAVVQTRESGIGLLTDEILRSRVLVESLSLSSPVSAVSDPFVVTALPDESSAEALIRLLDTGSKYLVVRQRDGTVTGIVAAEDFVVAPTTAGVSINEQIKRASSPDHLVDLSRRVPSMLEDVLSKGLAASRVIAVYSTIVDTIIRQSIAVVFADEYRDLSTDNFTWLSLGSNGRREAVLSSDVDAAVAFKDSTAVGDIPRYLDAFDDVGELLVRAGLNVDTHGAFPSRAPFARTDTEWRRAAKAWLRSPRSGQATIMTSLLADGRPIYGDRGLPEVAKVLENLSEYPATMELMLYESLAHRAKRRSVRTVITGRGELFDIKNRGLLPIVNIARWAALGVCSTELQTVRRLRAGAGSEILLEKHANRLIEVFDVLQRLRLRHQIGQLGRGESPSDSLDNAWLSPIDRTVVSQAVREITAIQRRMHGIAINVPADQWTRAGQPMQR